MYEKNFWMQFFSDDLGRCIVRNDRNIMEKLYTLVNGADGRYLLCGIVQDIQKNRIMLTVDKMPDGQCCDNPDRIFIGIYF